MRFIHVESYGQMTRTEVTKDQAIELVRRTCEAISSTEAEAIIDDAVPGDILEANYGSSLIVVQRYK